MPENLVFPEPEECPKLKDRFLEPPKPPRALDDIMEAIDGDGSPWAYLSASLFGREVAEFGAIWHGLSWSVHVILGEEPSRSSQGDTHQSRLEDLDGYPVQWQWLEAKPEEWKPTVYEEKNKIMNGGRG